MAVTINKKKEENWFRLYHSDALSTLKTLADNSVHAVVCDPPYGLGKPPEAIEMLKGWLSPIGRHTPASDSGFMGKSWDNFVPQPNLWKEVYRVLKPGGYLFCFAGTRTVDLMGLSLRIGGFEPVDLFCWIQAQGFPKGQNISKALDAHFGVDREVLGVVDPRSAYDGATRKSDAVNHGWREMEGRTDAMNISTKIISADTHPQAKKWSGWNTQIKPANEPILLMRKPLEGTYIQNILKHGVGALNIDASRIPLAATGEDPRLGGKGDWSSDKMAKNVYEGGYSGERVGSSDLGRYPTNVLVSHHKDCVQTGTTTIKNAGGGSADRNEKAVEEYWGEGGGGFKQGRSTVAHGDENGNEEVPVWDCHPSCPIPIFEMREEKVATAARFFYQPKSSKTDRNRYCSTLENKHVTVKPIALMTYLCKLITPVGGTILDPFTGSGTTGISALENSFNFIGIERDKDYAALSQERLGNCLTSII